jgi:hypothetical protein
MISGHLRFDPFGKSSVLRKRLTIDLARLSFVIPPADPARAAREKKPSPPSVGP